MLMPTCIKWEYFLFCIIAKVKDTKQDDIIKRNERIRKRFAYYTDTKHLDGEHVLDLPADVTTARDYYK